MNLRAVTKMCRYVVHRAAFSAKKNSPAILMITAGVTGLGCVVSACVATRKLDPIIEHHNKTLEETKDIIENEPEHFTEKQARRMVSRVYAHTALSIAKLYAPAFVLGATTVGCALGGYKIQANRIAYLSGALAAAERRIQTLQAKEQAEELEKIEDPEERKKKAEELKQAKGNEAFEVWWGEGDGKFGDPRIYGPYANPRHLRMTESYFNKILPIWGVVYLNDIFLALGKPRDKKARSNAGWVWDPNGGDHQIDLGLKDPRNSEFMTGNDPCGCWIIPNCEAYIYDKEVAAMGDTWSYYNSPENERASA